MTRTSATRIRLGALAGVAVGAALATGGVSAQAGSHRPSATTVAGSRVVTGATATFRLSAHEAGVPSRRLSFSCALDTGSFRHCGTVFRVHVVPGAHVLRVRATDPVGRVGPTTRVSFRVRAPKPPAPNPVQTIAVGGRPVDIAVGGNSLWVSNQDDGTISRIDPASASVTAAIPVGGQPGGLGFGDGSLWVANFGDGSVERIDPSTNAVTARIAVGGQPDGATTARDGTVWISDFAGDVHRIDPTTNRVLSSATLASGASTIAPAFGLLWVGEQNGTIATIDPSTGAFAGAPIVVDRDVDAFAAAPDGMWATTFDSGTIALVDSSTRAIVRKATAPGQVAGAALAAGSLWVSLYDRGEVVEVDPATLTVTRTVSVGLRPRTIVSANGSLWVVNELSGTVSRFAP